VLKRDVGAQVGFKLRILVIGMIQNSFRQNHLLNLLNGYEMQHLPLDLFMSCYFRAHKSLGAKDRGTIAETVYAMVRWKGLLDYFCTPSPTWAKRLEIFCHRDLEKWKIQKDIPLHIRLSFPKVLFDLMVEGYGLEKASELCRISNKSAPTTVRVNSLKTTREFLLKHWSETYAVSACHLSPCGIIFHRKINFFGLPEFKQGLFEVQDEGSQLLASLVRALPGQQVLDYCAGSGGKTLAFAPNMHNRGQIFLHDIRKHALLECRKRLRRAGIQNAQIVQPEEIGLKKLKKRMDWVLVDAPCTGTGTMRRNPDMKWKFTLDMVKRLIGQQRVIFEKALSYMKPEGRIVYMTCSMLKTENEDQMNHFLKTYDLEIEEEPFIVFPRELGMDGFFGVILKAKIIS
jgi:16S rRNA (cytosine967-C5)-methyltransferase